MMAYSARLKSLYNQQIRNQLMEELELKNIHQAPRLVKIVVSSGIGKHQGDKRYYDTVRNTLTRITGQSPVDHMARKSIAGFKIRAGMNRIGLSVTLRDNRMYEFLDRLINVSLPRVRDFHGVTTNFDAGGNFNIGISEQSIFPELTFEETTVLHGLQITLVIDNLKPEHARALLEKFGMPFEKKETK